MSTVDAARGGGTAVVLSSWAAEQGSRIRDVSAPAARGPRHLLPRRRRRLRHPHRRCVDPALARFRGR